MRRKKTNRSYKALLNKKDPLDKTILKLARQKKLSIGAVELKGVVRDE